MKSLPKIAVIGGTGQAGQCLVRQLLQQNFPVKLLVRNPERLNFKNPLLEIITGDVTNYESVNQLINGCQRVVSALGMGQPPSEPTVFSQSTRNILKAMVEHQVRRYVVITGLNVNTPNDKKSQEVQAATNWMYAHFPESTADKQREYDILSKSDVDWTLVRLPLIDETAIRGRVKVSLENCPGQSIDASVLAQFLVGQISDLTYVREAPFIANG